MPVVAFGGLILITLALPIRLLTSTSSMPYWSRNLVQRAASSTLGQVTFRWAGHRLVRSHQS